MSWTSRVVGLWVGVALAATGLATTPSAVFAADVSAQPTYASTAGNGWYVNDGIVRAMTVSGDVLVIGGTFTSVRNRATGQTVPRNRIAAFDRVTGDLLPTFAQGANGAVWALTSAGPRVWVGGDFTSIGGSASNRIAAFDIATGQPVGGFDASVSARVFALDNAAGTVYVGGNFGRVNGTANLRLAAVDGGTGDLRPGWSASANAQVRSVAVVPGAGMLAVGGNFTDLNTRRRGFVGGVRLTDGTVTSFAPAARCDQCWLLDLATSRTTVYAGMAGPGGRAMAWNIATSDRTWAQVGDGDVQVVELVGDTLYVGGHFTPRFGTTNGVAQTRHMLAAVDAATGRLASWAPVVSGGLGVWALWGDEAGLWAGGSFRQVSGGNTVARLARFTTRSLAR